MFGSAKKCGGAGTLGLYLAQSQACSPSRSQWLLVASAQSHDQGSIIYSSVHSSGQACALSQTCTEYGTQR